RAHDTTSGSSNDVLPCIALRTGFSTAKGQSVRLILFQNHRPQFKLYEDSFKYIGISVLMALLDFIIIVIMQALFGIDTWEIIFRADIQQQSLFLQIQPTKILVVEYHMHTLDQKIGRYYVQLQIGSMLLEMSKLCVLIRLVLLLNKIFVL
ncbi:MAG: hypothetical protein EZS28_048796, partial [Streblomastix strix]